MLTTQLSAPIKHNLLDHFEKSINRLIFLDYDGTLVPFHKIPEKAKPDRELIKLLTKLSAIEGTQVILVSGRGKEILREWFGDLKNIRIIAEHGAWICERNNRWETLEQMSQKWQEVRPILELYVDRTPGSFIEQKEFSLVWHYRKADIGLGEIRARELSDNLNYLTSNLNLQVLEGNKVIEVKNAGVNKGRAALRFVSHENWDFILAIGDDWTDEDIFYALPVEAYTIKVGFTNTAAKHKIKSYKEVRALLHDLVERNRVAMTA